MCWYSQLRHTPVLTSPSQLTLSQITLTQCGVLNRCHPVHCDNEQEFHTVAEAQVCDLGSQLIVCFYCSDGVQNVCWDLKFSL